MPPGISWIEPPSAVVHGLPEPTQPTCLNRPKPFVSRTAQAHAMISSTTPSPAWPDTRAARSAIFAALDAAPGGAHPAPPPAPDLQSFDSGPYAQGRLGARPDPAGLVSGFVSAATAWRADVLQATPETWTQVLVQALRQRGCLHVLVGLHSELEPELSQALAGLQVHRYDRPLEQWKHEIFGQMQASVTSTVAGVADTGTLVLLPSPQEPRTLSLIPPVHVAVLKASRLYASLPAAMAALQPQQAMPTNLLLVTGPSKTADIQLVLAYGAHGPKELVILLVNDLPDAQESAA